jgi:hypothetical protein
MAEALQREFSLPVLKVRLDDRSGEPTVRVQLVVNERGLQTVVEEQVESLAAFGFPRGPERKRVDPQLSVPPRITDWVASWVRDELLPNAAGGELGALWLHLVKPYGLLGAVPWERKLQPACGIPFLRLPDVLPGSERPCTSFEVALCATAPSKLGVSTTARMVPDVAGAIALGVGDRVRLHVFADAKMAEELEGDLAGSPPGAVVVHRPPLDFDTAKRKTFESAWLQWIRDATRGGVLDAVHFIVHGYSLGTEGAILTARSPSARGRAFPQAVQAAELRSFLTRVGAASVGFTAPVDNGSPFGLLRLVDDLGSLRAGPVVLHEPSHARTPLVLADAYRLLAQEQPGRPPADPSLVLFVQPQQIAGIRPDDARPVLGYPLVRSEAVQEQFRRPDTPLWVAAAEQYIKENEADLIRFRESLVDHPPTRTQIAHYAGVESALHRIRGVVDKHAEAGL